NPLLVYVDYEDQIRLALHAADTAEVGLELCDLTADVELLFLVQRDSGVFIVGLYKKGFHLFHAIDRVLDGLRIAERSAEPAGVNAEGAATTGLLSYDIAGLLRCSDADELAAASDAIDDELARLVPALECEIEGDDVDITTLAVDVRHHSRMPALGVVTKV